MTIFKLEKRVKNLEGKLCCIAHYYDTFEDFPEEGNENVLYVDKETGGIYIWNGDEYIKDGAATPTESYKVYTALLTQSVTDAPVATVLQNTIGEITWTYDDVGMYLATCSGCFTENKTMAILSLWGDDTATPRLGYIEWVSVNNIYLRLLSMAQNPENYLGGSNTLTSIEIRVYP